MFVFSQQYFSHVGTEPTLPVHKTKCYECRGDVGFKLVSLILKPGTVLLVHHTLLMCLHVIFGPASVAQ